MRRRRLLALALAGHHYLLRHRRNYGAKMAERRDALSDDDSTNRGRRHYAPPPLNSDAQMPTAKAGYISVVDDQRCVVAGRTGNRFVTWNIGKTVLLAMALQLESAAFHKQRPAHDVFSVVHLPACPLNPRQSGVQAISGNRRWAASVFDARSPHGRALSAIRPHRPGADHRPPVV